MTGIIDEPVQPGKSDELDLGKHSRALIKFIEKTNTPITIGIQGEWGSGKTSLLNSINHHFAEKNKKFLQIWINAWETSLLSTPEESLIKIIHEIIDGLSRGDTDTDRKDKIKKGAKQILRGALRIGATATLGLKAGDVAEEMWKETENSIKTLREDLQEQTESLRTRSSNPYENVIIYVDDLDRIVPKNAVSILELLKNIFNVPHCIFVLAIDYQVVVKGLEDKFGKQTAENEWEFRAFFDKIIQLPFMMPTQDYNISKYLDSLLKQIGFIDRNASLLDELFVYNIVGPTIGENPRSLKRLVNSLALLEKMREAEKEEGVKERQLEEKEKLLLLSILCLQIEFSTIYSLLRRKPDFTSWGIDFSKEHTKSFRSSKKDYDPNEWIEEFRYLSFDDNTQPDQDSWEAALFHICFYIPRLKSRFIGIYKFFSYIEENLLKDVDEIGEIIGGLLNQTDVTSVESTDSGHGVRNIRETKKDMNASEQLEAVNLKAQMIKEIRDAGSKIFASKEPRQGSYSLFITVNSSSKSDKDLFLFDNMPNLYPLWTYQFAHSVFVRLDGEERTSHESLLKFLEDKIPVLEHSLGVELGKWEVKNSIERQLKGLYFHASPKICLPKAEKEVLKDLGEERTEPSIEVFYVENPDWWEKAVQWGKRVVPIFENKVRELLRQYKVKEAEVIKSPAKYSGIGR